MIFIDLVDTTLKPSFVRSLGLADEDEVSYKNRRASFRKTFNFKAKKDLNAELKQQGCNILVSGIIWLQ